MIYNRTDKRVVDMCIAFDEKFPLLKDADQETYNLLYEELYKYLFLIYYSLAKKRDFFSKRYEDYEKYAYYAAATIFLRFLKKQRNGEPVDSVLNYAKATLNPLRVAYQNEEFGEVINPEANPETDISGFIERFRSSITDDYAFGLEEELVDAFAKLPRITYNVVYTSPFGNDKLLCLKLYTSCLLTLLKSFTKSNALIKKLNNKTDRSSDQEEVLISKAYEKDRLNSVTLWHLSDDYKNYIQLLTNKIRVIFGTVVDDVKQAFELDENVLDSIMASAYAMPDTIEEDY